ncbi:hypothetical protein ILUMI_19470, partial [Ignelater luminosus]
MDSKSLCQNGCNICESCAIRIKQRLFCKSAMTQTRNSHLEQLIDSLCRGKKFANWNCEWKGKHLDYFHTNHNIQLLAFNTMTLKRKLFWYKCKKDMPRRTVYWLFQSEVQNYLYKFTIEYKPIKFCKIKNVCESGSISASDIAKQGEGVLVFNLIEKIVNKNNNEISFNFEELEILNETVKQSLKRTRSNNLLYLEQSTSISTSGQHLQHRPAAEDNTINSTENRRLLNNFDFNYLVNICLLFWPLLLFFPSLLHRFCQLAIIFAKSFFYNIYFPESFVSSISPYFIYSVIYYIH